VVYGSPITVELILLKLGEGSDVGELLRSYPPILRKQDALAVQRYAVAVLAHEA
jgi:uncharacterized protein (DUF433 family)